MRSNTFHTTPARCLCALVLGVVVSLGGVAPLRGEVTGADVTRSMQRAVEFLLATQAADGKWHHNLPHYSDGCTALVGLALLNAGTPADSPAIRRALDASVASRNQHTYSVALKAMFLAQANPERYRREIQHAADWLVEAQLDNGMWTYTAAAGRAGDNSNTQFGVLGLYAAARANARVPDDVWRRVEKHFNDSIAGDGGWGYTPGRRGSTLSMTSAGVASLYMAGLELLRPTHRCGHYEFNSRIAWGLNWIGQRLNFNGHPTSHHLYMMYGIERVGVIGAQRHLGQHDWYRAGAEYLVGRQNDDGSWGVGRVGPQNVGELNVATSFGLLFLSKGRAPAMVAKLNYGGTRTPGAWNIHPYDARNLVAEAAERFGIVASWQVVTLDAPLEELARAPIVYINGHEGFTLTEAQKKRLAEYIDQGGTVFSVACCVGEHTGFDASARALYAELFPDRPLEALDAEHDIYRVPNRLPSRGDKLLGINAGCRLAIIHSVDRLACSWQGERTPNPSADMQLGVNICAYATGMEPLLDKLDPVRLVEIRRPDNLPTVRGAVVPAQLRYPGRWDNDALALRNLMGHLRQRAGLDVATQRMVVEPGDPALFNHPILYITGRGAVEFDDEVTRHLRDYLDRGGFIFADPAGGNAAFVESFRAWARRLYPDVELKPVALDHALYRTGVKVEEVRYKPAVLKERPDLNRPTLEAIEHGGRLTVVFSPYDVGCALTGFRGNSPGYTVESAFEVAAAVVLYALTH